ELDVGNVDGRAALEALVQGRLLVARQAQEGAAYELAHEALLSAWATLGEWLHGEAQGRAVRQRLELAAAEWERLGWARETLWGSRQLSELAVLDGASLDGRERAFLDASRRARRRRWVVRVAAGLVVPLALAGFYVAFALRARSNL